MMMTPKGNMDSKDVTLAYDDDAKVKIGLGTREVTSILTIGCMIP